MHASHPITPDRPPPPAKRTEHLLRPRLEARLANRAASPIVVLAAPAGSGKSELLRPLRDDARTLYYRVGNERATFARFVHGIAAALAHVAPGAQASFPRAFERALQSRSAGGVLAHWLAEHLAGIDAPLVIDDLHDATNPSIATFIAKFADLRPAAPLTIAVRAVGALPVALWMATRRMDRPIDEHDLRFDRAEVAQAAHRLGLRPAAADLDALCAASGGSPIAVMYALTRRRDDPRAIARPEVATSFEDIARSMFARRSGRERAFLFSATLFPRQDDALLALSGWDDAGEIRAATGGDAAFMWETDAAGTLRFHDRFRDFLAREFQTYDDDFRLTIGRRTVRTLTTAGRYVDALEVATSQRQTSAVAELLDEHGFALLESGNIGVISEAFDIVTADDGDQAPLGARATALRGYLDARSGRLDTSEAWFRLGLEKATDDASRVAIAMYYARELAWRRREDACEVLAPFADATTLPRDVLIDVRSAFAQALTAAGRLEEAARRTDCVVALLAADSPPEVRARVYARAAFVALECGALALARERAHIAAPLAIAASLFDVAASTYSVLYNLAYEIDDDAVASLEYLRHLRDLGMKSGALRLDLYALLGMYGLAAEAGDDAGLADLERQLAALDKHDATVEVMEGLLPAKALRATWTGRFDDAVRLLRPTAEIALFSAAAGDDAAARRAAATARTALAQTPSSTAQHDLTLLTLALAAWTSGDAAAADASSAALVSAAAPRVFALRAVLAALRADRSDPDAFAAGVRTALARLDAVAFGGMGRLIGALPDPHCPAGDARTTVAALLAERELPARFGAAAEGAGLEPLHAWLAGPHGSTLSDATLAHQFEAWVARREPAGPAARAAVIALRDAVAAHRRPAPAVLRLVDDIDVAIDVLFERLDAAAPLMAEHSRAVSAWCSRIARAYGSSESEIAFITRCGLIHDIGKTHTPAEILNAPRRLEPHEWAIMRDHAALGGRIIADERILRPFVPIVRGHHERLDGKGYPDGLRLGAIPLAARIVSVADSFNAMIGRRPYRLPLAPTEALAELERHRETQFDPEIVEVMVRIVQGRVVDGAPPNG
jgi:putative nucleotidyltransferase with HDIG domain